MRKILIGVLVALMLIGLIFFMVNGFTKINIKGVRGIDEKDTQINDKITDLSNISSVKYKEAESNLKQAAAKLIDVKTEYENQAALSNSNSSSYASKLETYDIDYFSFEELLLKAQVEFYHLHQVFQYYLLLS